VSLCCGATGLTVQEYQGVDVDSAWWPHLTGSRHGCSIGEIIIIKYTSHFSHNSASSERAATAVQCCAKIAPFQLGAQDGIQRCTRSVYGEASLEVSPSIIVSDSVCRAAQHSSTDASTDR